MSDAAVRYCERCGKELPGGLGGLSALSGSDEPGEFDRPVGADHDCVGHAEFEPPRYCAQCRRRMVVQLTPNGWSARCSRHGVIHADGTVGV